MKKLIVILCLVQAWVPEAWAQQEDSTRSKVEQDLEEALETFDTEVQESETEQLVQWLRDLAARPVNINHAGIDELLLVPGMNLKLADAITEYRQSAKPFENPDELLQVQGIGPATYQRMRPYITVGSGFELTKMLYSDHRYWRSGERLELLSRYQQTLQKQEGYRGGDSSAYRGSPAAYYQRLRYRSNHLSVNLTQQKDAGEPLNGINGFDYNSWHLALQDNGRLQQLVAGDYVLYFGQGLVLWNGRTFGKGRQVTGTANRSARGVQPYASSQESDFYRGMAFTFGGKLQLSGFYSNRSHSASVVSETERRLPNKSGYHRTSTERARRNSLKQQLFGGRLQWITPLGMIGVTGYQTQFDKQITTGTSVWDQYDFKGQLHSVAGVDYKVTAGPAIVFGEAARSRNGGIGFISGIEGRAGGMEYLIAYRNYGERFQSIQGGGFGEYSGIPKNEVGLYAGLRQSFGRYLTISAYFDQFSSPAPRFGVTQPIKGYDWLLFAEAEFNPSLRFYLQLRSETKEDEYEIADEIGRTRLLLGEANRNSFRAQMEYQVNSGVRLRTRGEVVRSRAAGEKSELGYMIFQDVRLTVHPKLRIDSRLTLFETESYASRLYQFENDLLYVMSNELLYNQGQHMYVLLNYEPWDYLELWAKFGVTIYEHEQRISSGLNEIRGNKRSEIGLQARFKI